MLDELLSIRTMDGVEEFGPKLLQNGADAALFSEIIHSGALLDSDCMYTTEDLDCAMATDNGCEELLKSTIRESDEERIVHLLQILSCCHRGVSSVINGFLERACL